MNSQIRDRHEFDGHLVHSNTNFNTVIPRTWSDATDVSPLEIQSHQLVRPTAVHKHTVVTPTRGAYITDEGVPTRKEGRREDRKNGRKEGRKDVKEGRKEGRKEG